MRFSIATLSALAGLLTLTNAQGRAIVVNNCTTDVFLWSVASNVGPQQTLTASGGSYSEVYRNDPVTGGIALKITTVANGLFIGGVPQTTFAYTLSGPTIWYDLSDVFGDPFAGSRLAVTPSQQFCGDIQWPNGTNPGGSNVRACSSNANVTLTLCAGG